MIHFLFTQIFEFLKDPDILVLEPILFNTYPQSTYYMWVEGKGTLITVCNLK